MDRAFCDSAREVLGNAGFELVRLYTGSALELNAFDVTAKFYADRKDDFFLTTTGNIPEELKLNPEIDHGKSREDLIDHYRNEALKRSCEDYLVRCVSVTDAGLEDVYDMALGHLYPEYSEQRRLREVRSAWAVDDGGRTKLATCLVDEIGLQPPNDKESTIDMVIDRYCEIRELRHALVHNGGHLSAKNMNRLDQLHNRLPAHLRNRPISDSDYIVDGEIKMTMRQMLIYRQWFYETILGFLRESIQCSYERSAGAA